MGIRPVNIINHSWFRLAQDVCLLPHLIFIYAAKLTLFKFSERINLKPIEREAQGDLGYLGKINWVIFGWGNLIIRSMKLIPDWQLIWCGNLPVSLHPHTYFNFDVTKLSNFWQMTKQVSLAKYWKVSQQNAAAMLNIRQMPGIIICQMLST